MACVLPPSSSPSSPSPSTSSVNTSAFLTPSSSLSASPSVGLPPPSSTTRLPLILPFTPLSPIPSHPTTPADANSLPTDGSSSTSTSSSLDTIPDSSFLPPPGQTPPIEIDPPSWITVPPTPPPKPYPYPPTRRRTHPAGHARPRPASIAISPPVAPIQLPAQSHRVVHTRRMSLPVSKPLPPLPSSARSITSSSGSSSSSTPSPSTPPVSYRFRLPSTSLSRSSSLGPGGTLDVPLSPTSRKRLFHICTEDDGGCPVCFSDREERDAEDERIRKSAIRRYHALMELLSTEVGYLSDLRALVRIYLTNLPSLTYPPASTRPTLPLTLSRPLLTPSYSGFVRAHARSESASEREPRTSTSSHARKNSWDAGPRTAMECDREPESPVQAHAHRPLLAAPELASIRRNAAQLLALHEAFVERLRGVLAGLGIVLGEEGVRWAGAPHEVDMAIGGVAGAFVGEAPRFAAYEAFCADHFGALELVRRVQTRYPGEWDAFERRCAGLVGAPLSPGPTDEPKVLAADEKEIQDKERELEERRARKKRRHSMSSLAAPREKRTLLRVKSNAALALSPSPSPPSSASASDTDADPKPAPPAPPQPRVPRLQFTDYLIKPAQRICKYPLLLDALAADSAARAMRAVATRVDAARHAHEQARAAALVRARLEPESAGALAPFLAARGPLHMAGALDVLHAPPRGAGSATAKYMGAFLYEGAFLVLARVKPGGRWEPRYWFVVEGGVEEGGMEEEDGEALLPCSFRLRAQAQEFELAASCAGEKRVWLDALRAAAPWAGEPPAPCCVGAGPAHADSSVSIAEDADALHTLPTIMSIPEMEHDASPPLPFALPPSPVKSAPPALPPSSTLSSSTSTQPSTLPSSTSTQPTSSKSTAPSPSKPARPTLRTDVPPSRRSSTASVKAFFSASPDSAVMVHRASPQARAEIDRELADVVHPACAAARCYAATHEQELFSAPKAYASASGVGMAGAMGLAARNRLTKRESVLVRRRRSHAELAAQAPAPAPAPSLAKKRKKKSLRIAVAAPAPLDASPPTPASACSSATGSTSPAELVLQLQRPGSPARRPQRSRSMVDNVRGFFHPPAHPPARAVSLAHMPASASAPAPAPAASVPRRAAQAVQESSALENVRRRWRESLRGRVRSDPEPLEAQVPRRPRAPERFSWCDGPQPKSAPAGAVYDLNSLPGRRRSVFGGARREREAKQVQEPVAPRRTLRTLFSSFARSAPAASASAS